VCSAPATRISGFNAAALRVTATPTVWLWLRSGAALKSWSIMSR